MQYVALPTQVVRQYQAGGLDANGQAPERVVLAEESGPCRHCLGMIAKGTWMLILAHRPFASLQPYAEVGPIFLCAAPCKRGGGGNARPGALGSPDYIVRGYGADDRIVYGSGGVIATEAIPARARALFADPQIAYLHVRSARNNCYQCRIDRA
jgi:hypothetical protein